MKVLDIALLPKLSRAVRLNARNPNTALFVTTLLRPREIKLATALRNNGWKVILLYQRTTPFAPEKYFDVAIQAKGAQKLNRLAKTIQPRICHVFSGAIDDTILEFCRDKPGPVVVDLNDVFAPSLFNYLHERFEPTRECLSLADGLVCRDLQPKYAERLDGFKLPPHILLFPEYSWLDGPAQAGAAPKLDRNEIHIVSVGTFTLEVDKMYDSAYLKLARMLADQKIHFHIYPHWFFQNDKGSMFRLDPKKTFKDFYALQAESSYIHMHESLPPNVLAQELTQYDYGLLSGGRQEFGQKLEFLTKNYMKCCYSGRISDYIDARIPTIINSEVEFNTRLLNHYKILISLDDLSHRSFKDNLIKIKHSQKMKGNMEKAAESLSLTRNAHRLGQFYEKIINENAIQARFSLVMRAAIRLPVIGRKIAGLRDKATAIPGLEVKIREQARALVTLENKNSELMAAVAGLNERMRVQATPTVDLKYQEMTRQESDELIGLLNWTEMADKVEREQGFAELLRMIRIFADMQRETNAGPSAAWALLNRKNLDQLLRDGYRRFKRTVALNYFTFAIQNGDPQIAEAEALVDEAERQRLRVLADSLANDPEFDLKDQRHFRYHTLLLCSYVESIDSQSLLKKLDEPLEGHPVYLEYKDRRVSQDMVNSLIEYYSIREGGRIDDAKRVLEIGGGYGRNSYVFKHANPAAKYVMLDIPPALYLAQRYLSSCFPEESVFKLTEFEDFDEVQKEFEAASFAFLLPHQIKLLPNSYFDLVINISSFGEMTQKQVTEYFDDIDRVGSGQFYTKQWRESHNPFDGLVLKEDDFPVKKHWNKIYSRPCKSQSAFFETLYDVSGTK